MKCEYHEASRRHHMVNFFSFDVDEDSGHFLRMSLDFFPRTWIFCEPRNLPRLVNLDPESVYILLVICSCSVGLKVALHCIYIKRILYLE